MPDAFSAPLAFTLREEGGDANNLQDPGGKTRKGITQRAFWKRFPGRDVFTATDAEIAQVYRLDYWNVIAGDQLPPAVALVLFDACVNQGEGYAPKLLQWSVSAIQDGVIGPKTLAAVATEDPLDLAAKLAWARVNRYLAAVRKRKKDGLDPWYYFAGWMARLDRVHQAIGLA